MTQGSTDGGFLDGSNYQVSIASTLHLTRPTSSVRFGQMLYRAHIMLKRDEAVCQSVSIGPHLDR